MITFLLLKCVANVLYLGFLLGSSHGLVLATLWTRLNLGLGLDQLLLRRRRRGNIFGRQFRCVLIDVFVQLMKSMRIKLVNVKLYLGAILYPCTLATHFKRRKVITYVSQLGIISLIMHKA